VTYRNSERSEAARPVLLTFPICQLAAEGIGRWLKGTSYANGFSALRVRETVRSPFVIFALFFSWAEVMHRRERGMFAEGVT